MEFKTGTPPKTGMYLVDRGMQGKYYRWYNAETDKWGMCGIDMTEAVAGKDNHSTYEIVGFFPWVGPTTGPNFDTTKPIVQVTEDAPKQPKKVARKMARQRTVQPSGSKLVDVSTKVLQKVSTKVLKTKGRVSTKVVHPDGIVFYREDRQKWIAMMNGKQEAARPTPEACLSFLLKKYNVTGTVLNKE